MKDQKFNDFIFIAVILLLLIFFAILLYLPKCCQSFSNRKRRIYPIEGQKQVLEEDGLSWDTESVYSIETVSDSSRTVPTVIEDALDKRTVEEIIHITINCPGSKSRRKAKMARPAGMPNRAVRNLNREISKMRPSGESFAV